MFCIYLRTNSDLCHLQHKLIGFYNRDDKYLQRGTNLVFNQSLLVTWCTNSLTFNNCTLCPHCIYVFCIYLRTNSDLCHLQHKLIGFYNRDDKYLQRGTNLVFNQSLPVTWCTNSLTFNNCTLCPYCIYVFCIYLRTNSDLCHLQHKLVGFYNRDENTARYGLGL